MLNVDEKKRRYKPGLNIQRHIGITDKTIFAAFTFSTESINLFCCSTVVKTLYVFSGREKQHAWSEKGLKACLALHKKKK